jgi:hypothetical protein
MDAPNVEIMTARVLAADGTVAAWVERVEVGGGSQTVTVDGVPEERVHPKSTMYHVRLLSPDRMIPDQLRDAQYYETAIGVGQAYAKKLDEHNERIGSLAEDLKVD